VIGTRAIGFTVAAALLAGCSSQAESGTTSPPVASQRPTASWAPPTPAAVPTLAAVPTPAATPWLVGTGQIVFEDYTIMTKRHQVWIADASGVRHLVSSLFDDARPSLSPDGKTVLFTRYGNGPDQAYLVGVNGSNLRKFPECPGQQCDPAGDAWSPDGRMLAVDSAFGFTNADGDFGVKDVSIWIVNLDGTGLREVTNNPLGVLFEDHRAVWSPDGKHLAFVRTDDSTNPVRRAIFTVAIDGTNLVQVTPWKLDANEPDWSPDGARIAFSSPGESLQPGREQNIFTIHPDGTGLKQLTAHLEAAPDGAQGTFDPSWSPDGTKLIFTHIPSFNGLADLYVIDADASDLHVLAVTPDLNESHAVWGVLPGT
jgi:TolB protein